MENQNDQKSKERLLLELGKEVFVSNAKRVVASAKETAGRIFDPSKLTDVLIQRRYDFLLKAGLSRERAIEIMQQELADKFPKEGK